MPKKYFKKTLAGVFAVAIVASAVPLAPFAPILDSIPITASAENAPTENYEELPYSDRNLAICDYDIDMWDFQDYCAVSENFKVVAPGYQEPYGINAEDTIISSTNDSLIIDKVEIVVCEGGDITPSSGTMQEADGGIVTITDVNASTLSFGSSSARFSDITVYYKNAGNASAAIPNSTLTYEIDEDGVLTISGDDTAFPDFLNTETYRRTEWCDEMGTVKEVVFNTPNLTSLGTGAFKDCGNLEKVTLPEKLETIGEYAFYGCTNLPGIDFPNTLKGIGLCAFCSCEALSSIKLPENITSIPEAAFAYTAIESIMIPASVTELGQAAFVGCPNLKAINVEADNSNYCSVDGVLFNKDKTTLMQYPTGKTDAAYIVPDTVTSISEAAFVYVEALTDITLPDSLTKIEGDAFGGTSIKSITIPDSVTSIGDFAFEYCTSLTEITLSNSLTTIGDYAFEDCSSLTGITIPASVTSVGYGVFEDSGLKSVSFECDDEDAIANFKAPTDTDIFCGCESLETIYVPAGCVNFYKNSDGFSEALREEDIEKIREMPTAEAKGMSASTDGDITLYLHYAIPEGVENGYVKFSNGTVVYHSEALYFGYADTAIFPISVSAKNMYDTFTAQYYDENGIAIGEAVEFSLANYLDSVRELLDWASDFVECFLDYGAQAAAYFGVEGAPAGKTDYDYDAICDDLAEYATVTVDNDEHFVGATLLLKTNTKLRLYYDTEIDGSKESTNNPGLYYVEKEIDISYSGDELNNYSICNYIYQAIQTGDDKLKALCASLYNLAVATYYQGM